MKYRKTAALFKRPKKEEPKKLEIWHLVFSIRTIEIIGVIGVFAALAVYGYEFLVEKPRDRAVAIASLYSQIAQTHALPNGEGYPAISRSVETLVHENVPLTNMDLSGVYFENVNLDGADFTNANLSNAVFIEANLQEVIFKKTNLTGASFNQANLTGTSFFSANLEKAKIYNSVLSDVTFSLTNLREAEFVIIYTKKITFDWRNNVTGAYFVIVDQSPKGWPSIGYGRDYTTRVRNLGLAVELQKWGRSVLPPEVLKLINLDGLCIDKGAEVPKFLPKDTNLEVCK